MPSDHPRRRLLAAVGAVAVGSAGCLGAPPASDGTESPTATRTETPTPTPTPNPPVGDEEATERALAAEEAYLQDRLSAADCLENWGTTPTTASREAAVVAHTDEHVRVELQHPYWYSTASAEADSASEAVYEVTADDERRVEGDEIQPC
ncbi:hypothetical protein [Haloparvum sedimenti]|uniref:hypothetical protein n=1 Tax=Haloparvum sedimenti TaxID=1678448 RepID=UPI00071E9ADA|nr:hypothetical protein [Haloparvum sedimenti]